MYTEEIKIPKERVGVLIGDKGKVKKKIEKSFSIRLIVNSKEGLVKIEADDSINLFNAKPMIRAICRGFNPEIAEKLIEEDNILEFVNLHDFSGKSRKKFTRLKCRVIGNDGKARKTIEDLTNTKVVIYGKTISIIGKFEDVAIAKDGFECLLSGAPHGNAYRRIIERKKKFNNQ